MKLKENYKIPQEAVDLIKECQKLNLEIRKIEQQVCDIIKKGVTDFIGMNDIDDAFMNQDYELETIIYNEILGTENGIAYDLLDNYDRDDTIAYFLPTEDKEFPYLEIEVYYDDYHKELHGEYYRRETE